MRQWDFGAPAPEHHEYYPRDDDALRPGDRTGDFYYPVTYERDPYQPGIDRWAGYQELALEPPGTQPRRGAWPDESWPPRIPARPRRRWLVPVAIALVRSLSWNGPGVTPSGGPGSRRRSGTRPGGPGRAR